MTLVNTLFIFDFLKALLTSSLHNFILILIILASTLVIRYQTLVIILFFFYILTPSFLPGLANSLSNIHPIMLILFTVINNRVFVKNIIRNTVFMSLSLVLGGWWASQEYNWGGWWNWDTIETPILIFIVFRLFFLHKFNYIYKSIYNEGISVEFLKKLLILIYLNTRFLDDSSIHSFVSGNSIMVEIFTWVLCFLKFNVLKYWVLYLITFNVSSYFYLTLITLLVFFYLVKLNNFNNIRFFKKLIQHKLFILLFIVYQFHVNLHNFSPLIFKWGECFTHSNSISRFDNSWMYCQQEISFTWKKKINSFLK